MFSFVKRSSIAAAAEASDSTKFSAANSSRVHQEVHRELVYVAFKDTVRHCGVPAEWLGCEVRAQINDNGVEHIEVQLIIKKWSGHLLRYAMAFQSELVQRLDRYEPQVAHGTYAWSWKFAADCDCPFPTMPVPQEWADKLEAKKMQKPAAATPRSKLPGLPPQYEFQQRQDGRAGSPTASVTGNKPFELRDIFSNLQS